MFHGPLRVHTASVHIKYKSLASHKGPFNPLHLFFFFFLKRENAQTGGGQRKSEKLKQTPHPAGSLARAGTQAQDSEVLT